jgi:hypothetical protein
LHHIFSAFQDFSVSAFVMFILHPSSFILSLQQAPAVEWLKWHNGHKFLVVYLNRLGSALTASGSSFASGHRGGGRVRREREKRRGCRYFVLTTVKLGKGHRHVKGNHALHSQMSLFDF